jgi:hypothetical protein
MALAIDRPTVPRRTAILPRVICSPAALRTPSVSPGRLEIAPSYERAQDLLLKAIDGKSGGK